MFREAEFRKRKGLSKLWIIRENSLKAVLRRIKNVGIRRQEKFKSFSMKQIIEILEKKSDLQACFYFLDKYSKKQLLTNAFLACEDDSLRRFFFDFVDSEKARLIEEHKQMDQAEDPFQMIPELIEDIDDIFRKKLLPWISVKNLSLMLIGKNELLDDAETLECCLMMLPEFASDQY